MPDHDRAPLPTDVGALARMLAPEIRSLPRLSRVVERFLRDAGRDTASATDFAAALDLDPTLRGWVLRQANSGFANLRRPVGSVAEACVVVGLEPLSRLVYAACTRDLLDHRLRRYPFARGGFWLHGLAVGIACRRLAVRLGASAPLGAEEAMVAGLLHDVGKLLLDARLPREVEDPHPATERHHTGVDHGLLSAAAMRAWGLPSRPVAAVAAHHAPAPVAAGRLIATADHLVRHWAVGERPYAATGEEPPVDELIALAAPLAADADLITRWCEELPPLVDGLQAMVRVLGHGTPPDLPAGQPQAASQDPPPAAGRWRSRRDRAASGRRDRQRRGPRRR